MRLFLFLFPCGAGLPYFDLNGPFLVTFGTPNCDWVFSCIETTAYQSP